MRLPLLLWNCWKPLWSLAQLSATQFLALGAVDTKNHSKHLEVNRSSTQCCVLIPSTYHVTYQHRDCDNNTAKKNEMRHMKHINKQEKKRITWELLFHPTSAYAKRIPAICSYSLKWPMYQCVAEMNKQEVNIRSLHQTLDQDCKLDSKYDHFFGFDSHKFDDQWNTRASSSSPWQFIGFCLKLCKKTNWGLNRYF